MYDELVNLLRELSSIPEHCENIASCDGCSKEAICLKYTNSLVIEVATQAADAIEELNRENESLARSVNEASDILRHRRINYCPNCGADMRIFSTNCKNTATTGEDREISNLRAWLKNGQEGDE